MPVDNGHWQSTAERFTLYLRPTVMIVFFFYLFCTLEKRHEHRSTAVVDNKIKYYLHGECLFFRFVAAAIARAI